MSFDIPLHAEVTEYVPDVGTNREHFERWVEEDDDSAPRDFFVVDLLPMSHDDMSQLRQKTYKKFQGGGDDALRRAELAEKRVFVNYCTAVRGLRLPHNGGVEEPKTGKELYDLSVKGQPYIREVVIEDILRALKNASKASEGDLKKSLSLRDSTKHGSEER